MPDTDITLPEDLLERILRKKNQLEVARPLPKHVLERLREEQRLQHTYDSNAIEGNTLTLQETRIVMEEGITVGGKTLREHLEVTGTASGFDHVWDHAKPGAKLDEVLVLELHRLVTAGILESPGEYRTHNVRISGAKKMPPDHTLVPKLMKRFLEDIRTRKGEPLAIAAVLHHRFAAIHPFPDGNGRVARLLTNFYLMSKGYPPVNLHKADRKRYYEALGVADLGNLDRFATFLARAVDGALTLFLSAFGGENELVPLADLARSSPYSQEYLSLRARQGKLAAVKIGGVWHSSKRELDDYIGK